MNDRGVPHPGTYLSYEPASHAEQSASQAERPAGRAEQSGLLSTFDGSAPEERRDRGLVSALIVVAITLVVALMALTIALGRATTSELASASEPSPSKLLARSNSTYSTPTPTGQRWTPEPIISGVPQNGPSQPPSSEARSEDTEAETDTDDTDTEIEDRADQQELEEPDPSWSSYLCKEDDDYYYYCYRRVG